MKRILCILLFCALLLTGCGAPDMADDFDRDEPIRIVATLQTSSPVTDAPEDGSTFVEGTPSGLWPGLRTDPPSMEAPTDAPSHTPAYTDVPPHTDAPGPDETPVPTRTSLPTHDVPEGELLVMIAQQYLNYPYTRGGDSPQAGFDPGGLVYWCLKEMGLKVKRRTSAGYSEEEQWTKITRMSELQPGDLVFFRTGDNENINCVCIYLGGNRMIYPSTSKQMVIVSEINSYWTNAFQWARRVF